jgi:hypothetical protein
MPVPHTYQTLHPLPEKSNVNNSKASGGESGIDNLELIPGFIAGVAKSFATKSAFAITAFGKGLLKWWFRVS